MGSRALKQKLRKLLCNPHQDEVRRQILSLPLSQAVSPLISFLYFGDDIIKWHAVSMLGDVVSQMALNDLEAARIVMRRLMWNLNDESGGIGWGAPEAMGEIMALNEDLAREYSNILISYVKADENYIEHEMLQRGVLWGIGRLGHTRPVLMENIIPSLIPCITAKDPIIRGLSVWIAGALPIKETSPILKEHLDDDTLIKIYQDWQFINHTIGELARAALSAQTG
jgi:HEAT repeat protein